LSFDPMSRYYAIDTTELTVAGPDGQERTIAYVRRRVIPSYDGQPALAEHRVSGGERLDTITARYAGDPTQFWRLCDANAVLRPSELEVVGRVVRIAMART
jgi:hypothetical protein